MTKEQIAQVVRRYVENAHFGDIHFVVDESRIQTGEGWFRVPVRPSLLPEKLFSLYEFLAELELEINEHEGTEVLLLIGEPLTSDSETLAAA